MNPDPTRLKIGDTPVEVRMNLTVNNLPVDHENLLNTEQAAKFLHVSVESLRRLVRRKAISSVSVLQSEHRFRKKDLEEYVMSRWNRRSRVCGDPAMNISGVVIMSGRHSSQIMSVPVGWSVPVCRIEASRRNRRNSEIERHQFDHDREGRIVTVALRD
jgi:excisionase family DNA binding protein